MQWSADQNAGFSAGKPWLPVGDSKEINVEVESHSKKSMLRFYQTMLKLRKNNRVLSAGSYRSIPSNNRDVFVFMRELENEKAVVFLNFSDQLVTVAPSLTEGVYIGGTHFKELDQKKNLEQVTLEAYEGAIFRI